MTRKTRVTKEDIEKARTELIQDDKKEQQERPAKKQKTEASPKAKWMGLVYCDSHGYSWVAGDDLVGVCLGKTDEIIEELKKVDTEDIGQILQVVGEVNRRKK